MIRLSNTMDIRRKYQCKTVCIIMLALFACNTTTDRHTITKKSNTKGDSVQTTQQTTEPQQLSDCTRGQAEPIIQKADYPNTTFVLQPDSVSAIETVLFDNGDKLIIRNWGCEYYVLTFRFETSRFQQDTTDVEYWFRAANKLMTGMLSGIDAPVNLKKGLNYLGSYIDRDQKNGYQNLKFGEEIDFGINEIRNIVAVEQVEKITDGRFAVTVSFSVGPL
jgi:hypothetical protein